MPWYIWVPLWLCAIALLAISSHAKKISDNIESYLSEMKTALRQEIKNRINMN